ncbi:LytTR family DNA-binding domain-containing protein [Phenylobacterium aquaticum]|uniref:LytTR family DNA-binding domain-containing protein n=1 Tax=Phenylobacterium aquaticum TaxID=1763816 RepID=UPI001F5D6B0E|nr:LytTR family DNA-binding domain-containing protein [Phenylobacterium aquaticum]MCI3135070.1 LytTR family transcriptional regulator DNA-binding domain-containing protein [Phenylobacterium aquaticum]
MTSQLRQTPGDAVRASSADPITWTAVARTLIGSSVVGGFLAFIGAFGTMSAPLILRLAYTLPMAWIGAILGLVCFRTTARLLPRLNARRWLQGVVSATVMTPFMGIFVWGSTYVIPHRGAVMDDLPAYIAVTFVCCQGFTALAVGLNRHAYLLSQTGVRATDDPTPPKFLERLPVKLRGAEIWAVEAEDHYLRLHTSKGQDLILLRLADAIAELEGIEGAQVHRSWWVSRAAIADARRGDGRAILTLQDGSEVPVSRTYAKLLREQGWI